MSRSAPPTPPPPPTPVGGSPPGGWGVSRSPDRTFEVGEDPVQVLLNGEPGHGGAGGAGGCRPPGTPAWGGGGRALWGGKKMGGGTGAAAQPSEPRDGTGRRRLPSAGRGRGRGPGWGGAGRGWEGWEGGGAARAPAPIGPPLPSPSRAPPVPGLRGCCSPAALRRPGTPPGNWQGGRMCRVSCPVPPRGWQRLGFACLPPPPGAPPFQGVPGFCLRSARWGGCLCPPHTPGLGGTGQAGRVSWSGWGSCSGQGLPGRLGGSRKAGEGGVSCSG